MKIEKVGVIGAGQMGSGIAHVCAVAGFGVMLNDLSPDRIKSALATINGNMARQVSKKLIGEDERKSALGRIQPAETLDALSDCDLVIETATEKEDVKRKIFAGLCVALKPEAIIGTNTSSISITRLASSTDRPERFIAASTSRCVITPRTAWRWRLRSIMPRALPSVSALMSSMTTS